MAISVTVPPTTRGRPRSPDTIARDEHIYGLLADGPRSRNQLAEQTGLEKSIVYLALDRLRQADRIRQCVRAGTIVWGHADGAPCP